MARSSTENPLALLPLPALADLSEEQVRGIACVWCNQRISTATAVDLGERRIRMLDGAISMFPRSCRPCIPEQIPAALRDHTALCEQCVDNPAGCDTARALRQLGIEAGR